MFMPALGRNTEIVDRTNRQAQTRPMSLQSHQVASGRAYFPNDDDTPNRTARSITSATLARPNRTFSPVFVAAVSSMRTLSGIPRPTSRSAMMSASASGEDAVRPPDTSRRLNMPFCQSPCATSQNSGTPWRVPKRNPRSEAHGGNDGMMYSAMLCKSSCDIRRSGLGGDVHLLQCVRRITNFRVRPRAVIVDDARPLISEKCVPAQKGRKSAQGRSMSTS